MCPAFRCGLCMPLASMVCVAELSHHPVVLEAR
jgi:hypothetical protein